MERAPHSGRLLIEGGRVIDPASAFDGTADVFIEDGAIVSVDKPGSIGAEGADRIDAAGKIVSPGFVDMHVHLREPGYEYKETIASGCMAAVVGGVTSVGCMANTNPVNDNSAVTKYIVDRAEAVGLANVFPIGAVSVGLKGEALSEVGEMFEAGIVAISDDGMPVMDSGLMRRALEYTKIFDICVIAHEEDTQLCCGGVMNEGVAAVEMGLPGMPSAGETAMVARDVELARFTGGRLHIAHVSTAESVEIIRHAKDRGISVTAEVSPHHFTLDETAVLGYNTNAKMKPPLRTARDVQAVRQGLADGTLDTIATDHAPHHRDEKAVQFDAAAVGIIGLETSLSLSLELVRKGDASLGRILEAMTIAPARNLGIDRGTLAKGAVADVTIFDPDREWTVKADEIASKSHNTPFEGRVLKGKVVRTIVGGRSVWEDPE